MKKALISVLVVVMVMAAGTVVAGKSSIEQGKMLFNDPTLGGSTNDSTCNSCHPDGKGLEKAGDNDKLASVINRCITGPLKGEKIDGRSVAMRSLKMYILSFGGE